MKTRLTRYFFVTLLAILLPGLAQAASKEEIDANVDEALSSFYAESQAGKRLANGPRACWFFRAW